MRNPRRYRWVPLPMPEPLDEESLKDRLGELPPSEELAVRMLLVRLVENVDILSDLKARRFSVCQH